MSAGTRYWAFISYSHADEAVATWLHRALETYRLPSRLVATVAGGVEIPARLFPVFRDRDELASAGSLGEKINDALARAEALIVIASKKSAASHWVNEEIRAFKALGKGRRVFCVIADGEPFASDKGAPQEECFAPALRRHVGADGQLTDARAEPIAADIRPGKDGRHDALLKLVAGILDIGLDALKQRDLQRRQRRLTVIAAAAVAASVFTTGLAFFAIQARNEAQAQRRQVEARNQQLKALADFQSRWLSRADVTELSRDLLDRLRKGIDAAAEQPEFADLDRAQLARFFDRLSASAIPADVARAALAAQLLNPALEEIEHLVAGSQALESGLEPALRASLGRAYHDLGLFQEGAAQLDLAVSGLARAETKDSPESLRARLSRLEARFQLGEYAAGLPEVRAVLEHSGRIGDTELEILSGTALGRLLLESGDAGAALDQLDRTLRLADTLGLAEDDPRVLRARQQRARALARQSMYPEVLAETRALRVLLERQGGRSSRQLRSVYGSLVEAAYMVRDLETAREVAAVAYERSRRDLGETHPETLGALQNYANIQFADQQYEAALILQEQLVEQRRRSLGIEHPLTLAARFNLALTLYNLGRFDEALALREAVLEARRRLLGLEHPHTLSTAALTARTLNALKRYDVALPLIEATLSTLRARQGEAHTDTLIAREVRASTLQGLGRDKESRAELRRAYDGTLGLHGPDHRRTQTLQQMLTLACTQQREPACELPHPATSSAPSVP